jgi:hypothetical protein
LPPASPHLARYQCQQPVTPLVLVEDSNTVALAQTQVVKAAMVALQYLKQKTNHHQVVTGTRTTATCLFDCLFDCLFSPSVCLLRVFLLAESAVLNTVIVQIFSGVCDQIEGPGSVHNQTNQ